MAWRGLVARWIWRFLPLVIVTVGILATMALIATKPQLAPVEVAEKVWTVQAEPARTENVRPDMVFYGEVTAGRQVELRPLVSGRVVTVNAAVEAGGYVEAGEMLIAIDRFDYEIALSEAKADLAEAKARLSELTTDIAAGKAMLAETKRQEALREQSAARWAKLKQRGAASTSASDDAEMALLDTKSRVIERTFAIERLEANHQRQQAVIARAEARLRQAERDLSETELTAPFAGYLSDIGVEIGRQVTQADQVARLIDPSRLEVRFHIGTSRFGELMTDGDLIGRPVDITWQLQGRPLVFRGKVARLGAEVDAASGGVEAYAEIDNPERFQLLRPGAFVEVKIAGPEYRNVVRLPESAWYDGVVYSVAEGRLRPLKARLVRRIGQDILIEGEFSAQDHILVTPIPRATDGMRVEIAGEGA